MTYTVRRQRGNRIVPKFMIEDGQTLVAEVYGDEGLAYTMAYSRELLKVCITAGELICQLADSYFKLDRYRTAYMAVADELRRVIDKIPLGEHLGKAMRTDHLNTQKIEINGK